MDQTQMFRELQNLTNPDLINDEVLADLIIVSSLLGEVVLTGILYEEFIKFQNFNAQTTEACEKAEFNRAAGEFLKGVCCVENAFAHKIKTAIDLKRVSDENTPPVNGDCCPIRH